MAPAVDGRIVRTFDAFAEQRQRLVDRITAMVIAELGGFAGWYDQDLIDQLTAAIAAKVATGQRGIAALTDAYLARVASLVLARPVSPAGVPAAMAGTLRTGPADARDVYARLVKEYRYQRSVGLPHDAAVDRAVVRADEMVQTDLGLAHQHQAQRFMRSRGVDRYRRVIRSEKTCGLCAAASDRIYYKQDLLPIHVRCRCGVIPVTAADPGARLNGETLGEIYKAAGSTNGARLKRVQVVVHHNSELGPQLRVAGQNFRGPDDIPAAA